MTGADRAPDAVIAVPAHDEAAVIEDCIDSLALAVDHARVTGAVGRARIVVAAHRCTDATADRARRRLEQWGGQDGDHEVVVVDGLGGVGTARHRAATAGLDVLNGDPAQCWVFSTDADSVVPADWIDRGLAEARSRAAVVVAGMTRLRDWVADAAAASAYRDIIRSGLCTDADGWPGHTHVYGANLLVRADAYRSVGGFAPNGHGEDRRLVAALRLAGLRVASSRTLVVSTSGRTDGRAPDGLADLLHSLNAAATDEEASA